MTPCRPFVINLVFNPLNSSPVMPSLLITSLYAYLQVNCFDEVCLTVFITLMEFETVSDTMVQQKPIKAPLKIALSFSSLKLYLGIQQSKQLLVKNQGQCPTIVAVAEAIPPWQKAFMLWTLYFYINICKPFSPWTCFDVFQASMGRVESRQMPAKTEPKEVWIKIGEFFRFGEAKMLRANMFAAVSPNRAIGPIIKAGTIPRQNR